MNGEIIAMAGASPEHDVIKTGLDRTIGVALAAAGSPCIAFSSDTRVLVAETGMYAYPDLTVVCGRPEFDRTHRPPSLLNPRVIFEILSPSTAKYDEGAKRAHYRRRESLQAFVTVATDDRRVIVERRGDDGWWASRIFEDNDTVPLARLGIELEMDAIYAELDRLRRLEAAG